MSLQELTKLLDLPTVRVMGYEIQPEQIEIFCVSLKNTPPPVLYVVSVRRMGTDKSPSEFVIILVLGGLFIW